jgi:hypothetical protein
VIFVGGRRLMGRVEENGGTYVTTEFVHAYWLPIFPLRSQLVLESSGGYGVRRGVVIPLHKTSVLAGYLRAWGPIAAAVSLLLALAGAGTGSALGFGVAAGLIVAVTFWAWARLGRLSAEALAQRKVYAALTKEPVDAALLCRTADSFRSALLANVAEGARGMMTSGYRTAIDPEKDWGKVALDPTVQDPLFLQACLTLSRIEWGRAHGPDRAALDRQHRAIWRKLQAAPLLAPKP